MMKLTVAVKLLRYAVANEDETVVPVTILSMEKGIRKLL